MSIEEPKNRGEAGSNSLGEALRQAAIDNPELADRIRQIKEERKKESGKRTAKPKKKRTTKPKKQDGEPEARHAMENPPGQEETLRALDGAESLGEFQRVLWNASELRSPKSVVEDEDARPLFDTKKIAETLDLVFDFFKRAEEITDKGKRENYIKERLNRWSEERGRPFELLGLKEKLSALILRTAERSLSRIKEDGPETSADEKASTEAPLKKEAERPASETDIPLPDIYPFVKAGLSLDRIKTELLDKFAAGEASTKEDPAFFAAKIKDLEKHIVEEYERLTRLAKTKTDESLKRKEGEDDERKNRDGKSGTERDGRELRQTPVETKTKVDPVAEGKYLLAMLVSLGLSEEEAKSYTLDEAREKLGELKKARVEGETDVLKDNEGIKKNTKVLRDILNVEDNTAKKEPVIVEDKKVDVSKDESSVKTKQFTGLLNAIERADSQDRPIKMRVLEEASKILGDQRFAEAVIRLKAQRPGVPDEYTVPQAMKDAYELAEKKLRGVEKEKIDGERLRLDEEKSKQRLEEIKNTKDLLEYLNKARQDAREARNVYRYVMGSKNVLGDFPDFLKQRPDLAGKFGIGVEEEYGEERKAAHDLIEFLANEAEARIRELEREADDADDADDAEEGKEETPSEGEEKEEKEEKEEVEISGEEGGDIGTEGKREGSPTKPEKEESDGEPEELTDGSLDEARALFLKALRLRGNVFRGALGRFFGRTFKVKGKILDFGGQQDLDRVRYLYEDALRETREKNLIQFAKELEEEELLPEETQARMTGRVIELMAKEQEHINFQAVKGIEKGVFEKLKTKFRQMSKTRLFGGLGLTAVAATGGVLGVVAGGSRAILGGAGVYTGVEAGLQRYSKLLGHKGLVDDIQKQFKGDNKGVREYIGNLDPQDIQREVARLRMLQVEKGIDIARAGRLGGKTTEIVSMLLNRDYEHTAREAAQLPDSLSQEEKLGELISRKLSLEEGVRDTVWADETDREHVKKLGRKLTATIAGGATGWLIGSKYFSVGDEGMPEWQPDPNKAGSGELGLGEPDVEYAFSDETPTPPNTLPDLSIEVGSGDSLWDILETELSNEGLLKGLNQEQATYAIDKMKDVFGAMDPVELKNVGISSGDMDLLRVGETIDLSPALADGSFVAQAINEAKNLSIEALKSIKENNEIIREWLQSHPNEFLSSEKVADIIAGKA